MHPSKDQAKFSRVLPVWAWTWHTNTPSTSQFTTSVFTMQKPLYTTLGIMSSDSPVQPQERRVLSVSKNARRRRGRTGYLQFYWIRCFSSAAGTMLAPADHTALTPGWVLLAPRICATGRGLLWRASLRPKSRQLPWTDSTSHLSRRSWITSNRGSISFRDIRRNTDYQMKFRKLALGKGSRCIQLQETE